MADWCNFTSESNFEGLDWESLDTLILPLTQVDALIGLALYKDIEGLNALGIWEQSDDQYWQYKS